MRYDLLFVLYNILHVLPLELFGLLCPRTAPFADHSNFFRRHGIKLEVLLGFENFQIVAHGFLGCQFLKKYRIFHFCQFLMHQKKVSGYFAIAEYVISRHISRCTSRIYIVLYGYKLFAIFVFLPFSAPLEK